MYHRNSRKNYRCKRGKLFLSKEGNLDLFDIAKLFSSLIIRAVKIKKIKNETVSCWYLFINTYQRL